MYLQVPDDFLYLPLLFRIHEMPYYYFPFVEHLSTSFLLKDWIDSYTFFYSSYHLLLLYVIRIALNRDTSHFISKNILRDDDVSKRARSEEHTSELQS